MGVLGSGVEGVVVAGLLVVADGRAGLDGVGDDPLIFEFQGGDVVGMSPIPEVLVARDSDLPVFVLSVVTNKCIPLEELTETTVEEVIAVAQAAEPKMTLIVRELLKSFA